MTYETELPEDAAEIVAKSNIYSRYQATREKSGDMQ